MSKSIEELFYPDAKPEPKPAPVEEKTGGDIFDDISNAPARATEFSEAFDTVEIAEEFYGETDLAGYEAKIAESMNRISDVVGLDPEDALEQRREAATFFRENGFDLQSSERIFDLIAQTSERAPDEKTVNEWTIESRRFMREQYGDEAQDRIDAAIKLVQANPGLQHLLQETGLGSHPEIVRELAERAWAMRHGR